MTEISYGIGKDYLPNWSIKEALREIFQNYIDFGEYLITTKEHGVLSDVTITNSYIPKGLEFLRIGNSHKDENSIGKWGEGLKMAILVFLREGIDITIMTNKHVLQPIWKNDKQIGKVLAISYDEHKLKSQVKFITKFTIRTNVFKEYVSNIITESDRLYEHTYHGSIVDKPTGNIYCGRLFVCHVDNMTRAYDLKPDVLPLDRDRVLPRTLDVNYHCSKLNEYYDKWTTKDLSYNDTSYIQVISDRQVKQFKPIVVEGKIEILVTHDDRTTDIVTNTQITNAVESTPFYRKKLEQLNRWMARGKSNKELLIKLIDSIEKDIPNDTYLEILRLIHTL